MTEGIMITLKATVKALSSHNGRRMVEVEASNQEVDSEGDIILQQALLRSAASFVAKGHIDIDHISEIGTRLGVRNPESYVIGNPIEVKDLGAGRTSVLAEIRRSVDGNSDPMRYKFDAFWESLISEPPVMWRASIYGFPDPTTMLDCRTDDCPLPASRYIVKDIDWRSLAMTRRPINDTLKGYARVVTAKAFISELLKDNIYEFQHYESDPPHGRELISQKDAEYQTHPHKGKKCHDCMMFIKKGGDEGNMCSLVEGKIDKDGYCKHWKEHAKKGMMPCPRCVEDLWGQYEMHVKEACPHTFGLNSIDGFADHFIWCCGLDCDAAKLFAHALMSLVIRQNSGLPVS